METKTLTDFLQNCKSKHISENDMLDFIQQYTNNFEKKRFQFLRDDLNKYANNIKFKIYIETKNMNIDNLFKFETSNGSIYCYESPRTVYSYIEDQQEYLSLVLTPRQKINFVVFDCKEKGLEREIFEDDYFGFLLFSDMVEKEYKEKFNQNIDNLKPADTPPTHFTITLNEEQLLKLYTGLTENGFLPIETTETDFKAFSYIFGGKGDKTDFKPIMWIKTNSTTHGKNLNKKSLLNLLNILDIHFSILNDKAFLNKLFIQRDGKSIKFTASNYSSGFVSEYNDKLIEIVNSAK